MKFRNENPSMRDVAEQIGASPILPGSERVKFESAAEGDDEQQAARQTADQRRRDHFARHGSLALTLVAAISAVLLAVTAPRLQDAQIGRTVERSRLAGEAVLFIRAVRALLLIITALVS